MIIGAQKAGTTSLKNYLGEHPEIVTHTPIEFSYFRDTEEYEQGFDKALKNGFGSVNESKKVIAKNAGMYYEYESIRRLKEHNPDCKVVFLLREPVARLISAYKMERYNGWLKNEFHDLVKIAKDKNQDDMLYRIFLNLGEYSKHLEQICHHFPLDQIKLIDYERLNRETDIVCQDIFKWLNVSSEFEPNTEKRHNESKKAKSKTATSLISWLRSENNLIKKIAKAVIPSRVFSNLGNKIIESNKSNSDLEVNISEEDKKQLVNYYDSYNQTLRDAYGFDISNW